MKAVICTVMLSLIILAFAGCEFTINARTRCMDFTRGSWHDNIYVNEFLGLQFELPETWFIYTTEHKDVYRHMADDFALSTSPEGTVVTGEDSDAVLEMRARDFFNNNSITVIFQDVLVAGVEQIDGYGKIQMLADFRRGIEEIYQNTTIGEHPRRLGNTNWYYATHDFMGRYIKAEFASVEDGILRTIMIVARTGNMQDIEDMWGKFHEIAPNLRNAEGVIPAMADIPSLAHHGAWNGRVYTNPSLNLKFSPPDNHNITTNYELAEVWRVPASLYGDGLIDPALWVASIASGTLLPVMRTYNDNGSSVLLIVRRIPFGMRELSINRYLYTRVQENIEHWQGRLADVYVYAISDAIEISGNEWIAGRIEVTRSWDDLERIVDTFVTVVDGYVWLMQIESSNEYELLQTLSLFSQP